MKANSFIYAVPAAACLLCSAMGAEPITANPAAAGDGIQIGVAKRDGITMSGGEAYVTRNGATEKLTKELVLPSGVIARPDGTIILANKNEATLRASQLLTFDGKVVDVPPDPNVNPAPRNAAATSASGSAATGAAPGTNARVVGSSGTRASHNQNGGGGSVFLGSDGAPFMGSIAADGSIVNTNGVTIANDGTIRAVTFGQDGTPVLGKINPNGTITQADGSTVFPDGSVRSANGTILSPPRPQNDLGTANNGNSNPGVPPTGNNRPEVNNGVAGGSNTNSPNNTGTVNVGNARTGANSPNNTGTVNNPNPGAAGSTSAGTTQTNNNSGTTGTARGTGGAGATRSSTGGARSTNGGASGTGASGAGGASGGSGGGATR